MHLTQWHFYIVTFQCLISLFEAEEHHFILAPQNTTVQLYNHFQFHCQVSRHGHGTVRWLHNGDEMSRQGQNYRIFKNGTLVFSKVLVFNRGWYQCRLRNSIMGTMACEPAYLTVHAPAVIIKKHVSQMREEPDGWVVYLSCHAAGIPPPVIEWRRNGNVILKNQSNPLENQTEADTSPVSLSSRLRIIISSSAVYSCSAVNYPLNTLTNVSETYNITADHGRYLRPRLQSKKVNIRRRQRHPTDVAVTLTDPVYQRQDNLNM